MGFGKKIGIIIVIVAAVAGIGLASPLFYDTEINEPLPTGAKSIVEEFTGEIMKNMIDESIEALNDPPEDVVAEITSFTAEKMMDVEMLKETVKDIKEGTVDMKTVENAMLTAFKNLGEKEREMVEENPNDMMVDMLMNAAARTETSASDDMDMSLGPTVLKSGNFDGLAGHRASGTVNLIDVDGTNYLRFEDFTVTNGPDLRVYVTPDGNVNNGIHLEKLKGSRGAQNYDLGDIDIEKHNTVVIYCQPFGAYFASAKLT